jgi:hypothetical protein
MKQRNKAVLVNVALLATFIIEYFRGYTLSVLAISATIFFTIANLALFVGGRKQRARLSQSPKAED